MKVYATDISLTMDITGKLPVDALLDDQRNVMMGIQNDEIVYVPFSKAIKNDKPINRDLLNTLRISSI